LVAEAKQAEADGFTTFSTANIFGHDAIGALGIAGWETSSIGLLTAVVPTYPRHPAVVAQQALTTQAAANGRFTLGIGLSHQVVIEGMYGMSFDKPARHMREYLAILMPLLRGESVQVSGEQLTYRGGVQVGDFQRVQCVVAAMGSVMLRLAGEMADGTVLWMTTAKAIRDHIAPRIRSAAVRAGRPDPMIVCSLPIGLTNAPDEARDNANKQLAMYGTLPSYRAMLDESGLAGPGEAGIFGDEAALDRGLRELEEAGVSHFNASAFPAGPGSMERTREYMAARARG
jgi:F420-dependent oxidoreductase-like protein